MDGAPSKIHLTSKAYLSGWALPDGWLRPVDRKWGRQKPRQPAAVAWRRDWWGKDNPQLNTACEGACNRLETLVPELLSRVGASWPLNVDDRGVLAQFIALHIVRSQAFVEWFVPTRENSLREHRDRFDTEEQWNQFCTVMRSDGERAQRILGLLNKLATLVGSMHWTLLTFDEPLLVTGDQSVAAVPLLDSGEHLEVSAMPPQGWAETTEIRFPVSPCEALLATWYPLGPEGEPRPGTWGEAVNLNGIVRAQSRRYYQVMTREPAMPAAILRKGPAYFPPLSPMILPGYNTAVARGSDRRLKTREEVERLVERSVDDTLTLVLPNFAKAA